MRVYQSKKTSTYYMMFTTKGFYYYAFIENHIKKKSIRNKWKIYAI